MRKPYVLTKLHSVFIMNDMELSKLLYSSFDSLGRRTRDRLGLPRLNQNAAQLSARDRLNRQLRRRRSRMAC